MVPVETESLNWQKEVSVFQMKVKKLLFVSNKVEIATQGLICLLALAKTKHRFIMVFKSSYHLHPDYH